ncbi:MAG: PASTA domain-containing protein [Gaiellaceae bacterium]
MAARLTLLLPRLAVLVVIWLLAAASFTFAAGSNEPAAQGEPEAKPAPEKPSALVVPDVRGQTYVFAKGMLEDGGFAWRVEGDVDGYAANTVAVQNPAPSVRVVDNGAPTVVLRLDRNREYEERGLPENASPYRGTPVVLLEDWRAAQKQKPATKPKPKPAAKKPKTKPAPPAKSKSKPRKPDFVVAKAPREPADEMPLPNRARLVDRRLAAVSKATPKVVNWWLYQHSWIVTGALYGWKDGDQALRILIRVDRDLQARFGFGAKSEQVARRALAEVLGKKR